MPETPRDEDLATSAGVMAAEYAPCVIRTGAAAPQLRSRLELLVKKKIGGGWQERWVLLQGEILMAFDTEAALNNVVERIARNDPAAVRDSIRVGSMSPRLRLQSGARHFEAESFYFLPTPCV